MKKTVGIMISSLMLFTNLSSVSAIENAASGNEPAEETFTSSQINQAKAAYFDAQVYTIYEGAARIDIKK